MSLFEVLLNNYLSKEDVQQLARDRGLPTGRTKGDLIELLISRHLDPVEALEFLNVTALRDLCREFGLDRSGDRGTLVDRLVAAIESETHGWNPSPFRLPPTRDPEDKSRPKDGVVLHLESAGPWTVMGIVATAIVAGVLVLAVGLLGTTDGVVASVAVAICLGIILLRTSHRWHPRIVAMMRPSKS